jgi:hypothetical protein
MVYIDIPEVELREDTILEAVAGRLPKVPPSVAISLLADIDIPGIDQQGLLQDVVQNSELDPQVRAGAVRAYMRVAGEGSVPTLLQVLESPTERVAAAAAAALGHVGRPDELDALQRLRTGDGGELLRARAAFAEVLIVHRFGLADREVALPSAEAQPAPSPVGALVFSSVRPGPARRDRALKAIKREFPPFDVGNQDVYEVQCGPRLLEIAVDRDFAGSQGVERLGSRPATPAIVAMQNVEHDDFYPGLIALSRPSDKDRVTVQLSRLSGDAVYVAEGSSKRGELEFDLRAVEAPGVVPVAGRVRLTATGIEISGVSDRRSAPKRNPHKE